MWKDCPHCDQRFALQASLNDHLRECGGRHEGFGPGTYGCHEAMHMASFLAEAVNEQLVEHRAIAANQEWSALARSATETLMALYQKIGAEHLERQNT